MPQKLNASSLLLHFSLLLPFISPPPPHVPLHLIPPSTLSLLLHLDSYPWSASSSWSYSHSQGGEVKTNTHQKNKIMTSVCGKNIAFERTLTICYNSKKKKMCSKMFIPNIELYYKKIPIILRSKKNTNKKILFLKKTFRIISINQ